MTPVAPVRLNQWSSAPLDLRFNACNALLRLAFALASGCPLTKPLPISRRLILPQARGQALRPSHCLSDYGFMCYFTPLQGFSFTFPSRYFFAIGHPGVFSLTRWSSLIHTGFHVPHATRDKKQILPTSTGDGYHKTVGSAILQLHQRTASPCTTS